MKVTVKFFALGRELTGKRELVLELTGDPRVGTLLETLKNQFPKLGQLNHFLVAVNMEYADMNRKLADGDEVAIIPPVSGG